MIRQVKQGDSITLNFSFIHNGKYVTPSDTKADIIGPLNNLIGTIDLSEVNNLYSGSFETVDCEPGSYVAIGYGVYDGMKIYATSPQEFDVVDSIPSLLVSVEEVSEYLGGVELSEFPLIEFLIRTVSSLIYKGPEEVTEIREIVKTSSVFLKKPIYKIEKITVDETELKPGDYITLNNRIVFSSKQTGKLKVEYVAGFKTVPVELRLATLKIVSKLYSLKAKEGMSNQRLMSYTLNLDKDSIRNLFFEVEDLLKPYQIRIV